MLPGINQWAFPPAMPTNYAISAAKRAGFAAFEVCVGDKGPTPIDLSEKAAASIRAHAEKEGIALKTVGCGMGWDFRLTSCDPAKRAAAKQIVQQSLEAAHRLGADAVLLVPGMVDVDTPYDAAIENALQAIRELADTAEKLEVSIAIENVWNRFLLSPVEFRDFIDQCESRYVGAYFDTGNILAYGYPEQWIRILGDRIRAIHLKDFRGNAASMDNFVMLMEGDVNWPAVMKALREIEYDGALIAEYAAYKYSLDTMLAHVRSSIDTILTL